MADKKFNPMNPSGPPPLISKFADRMALNSGSRNWQNTEIRNTDAQLAFEEHVASGMKNSPDMRADFDDFLKAHNDETRSRGFERSSLRHGPRYESDDFS